MCDAASDCPFGTNMPDLVKTNFFFLRFIEKVWKFVVLCSGGVVSSVRSFAGLIYTLVK